MIKKLRNLLSTSKQDRNSTSFDNKLSLPELFIQKCPAPPNPYFCSSTDTVGAEKVADKKDLICVDGTTMKPYWRRNSKTDSKREKIDKLESDSKKATKTYSGQSKVSSPATTENNTTNRVATDRLTVGGNGTQRVPNSNSSRNGKNSGGSKIVVNQHMLVQQTVEPQLGAVKSLIVSQEAIENLSHVVSAADDKMTSHAYQNSVNRESHAESDGRNVHNYYNGFEDTTQNHLDSSKISSSSNLISTSASWNASGACRVTTSSLVADTLSCSCGQCHPVDEPVKDCDWGWFTNSSANNVTQRRCPLIDINDHPKLSRTSLESGVEESSCKHSYVNEEKSYAGAEQNHFRSGCEQCTAESKMAFTIMEGSGDGLQVTIKGVDQEKRRFSQSFFDSSNHVTAHSNLTATHSSRTGILWMQSGADNSVNSVFARHPSQEFPIGSMAPSLPLSRQGPRKSPDTSAGSSRVRSQQYNLKENVNKNSTTGATAANGRTSSKKNHKNAPNFELTMRSYSKLIAYFDTNKLLISASSGNDKTHASSRSLSRVGGSSNPTEMHPYPSNQAFSQQASTKLSSNPHRDGASCSSTQSTSSSPDGQVLDLCRLAKVLETVEECPWYWGAMTGQNSKLLLRDSPPGTFLLRDSSDPRFLFSLSIKTKQGPTSIRIVYTDGAFRFDSEMDDASSGHHHNGSSRSNSTSRDHPNYVKRLTPVFTCVINMVLFYTNHLGFPMPYKRTCNNNNSSTAAKQNKHTGQNDYRDAATGSAVLPRSVEGVRPSTVPTSRRSEQFMCYWVSRHGRQEIPVLLANPKTQGLPSLQRLCRQSLSRSQKLWLDDSKIDQFPLPNSLKKYIRKYPYPL